MEGEAEAGGEVPPDRMPPMIKSPQNGTILLATDVAVFLQWANVVPCASWIIAA